MATHKSPLVIGLTGSYASGKSTAAEIFRELGAKIIDADILAREVVAAGSPVLKQIEQRFGSQFITAAGELDRKKLGELVFSDKLKKKELESITHPPIRELFKKKLSEFSAGARPDDIIIYVVPLLFESTNSHPELKKIIVVSAEKEISIERIMRRDNCSRESAERRYNSQLPIEEKERRADYIIKNNKGLSELRREAERLYSELKSG